MPTIKERRLNLDKIFKEITPNVYYQPPASIRMTYPAIRYNLSDIPAVYADDIHYMKPLRYIVTVIDKDPDSVIAENVGELKMCSFNRSYASDNLNHFVFEIVI